MATRALTRVPCYPSLDSFALSTLLTALTATKATIVRAEGAQQNGFENIGLFAAAVVIGNVAKLDNWTLNALSVGYLASRVAYNVLYITGTTDAMGEFSPPGHARAMLMFQ
jgi:hypothetical protein